MEEQKNQNDSKNDLDSALDNQQQKQLKSKKSFWWVLIGVVLFLIIATVISVNVWNSQNLNQEPKNLENIISETSNKEIIQTQDEPQIHTTIEKITKKILYKTDNNLILYTPSTTEKNIILSSNDILDFDLSKDQEFIVYTLKEGGFEGNSDIYLKNIASGDIVRLTEKNNMASFNPIIFPDNSKIAYVRRIYNPTTKKLSDGEIWTINVDGDAESSKKLFGSNDEFFIKESDLDKIIDENGKWTGDYLCITQEEIDSSKIGIRSISSDGAIMNYWQKRWAPECSGLWETPRFSEINESDFFTEKFRQQNTFNLDMQAWDQEKLNWQPEKIFWLDDGGFVLEQSAPAPIAGNSIYYFDEKQNKQWEIFDSFKQEARKYDTQILIDDIIKKDNGHFIIAYSAYKRLEDTKYFVDEFNFGDKVDIANLNNKNYFAIEKLNDHNDQIYNVEFLDDNYLIYSKQLEKDSYGLYLYNITKNKEQEIMKTNSVPEFKI
ncbi:MAG: hypothetical protein PF488_01005 [Patescibacteria group bacterium]|jgi:hypothetical protein|nr:hypothetical protein [Patescibacteria group bacterium]